MALPAGFCRITLPFVGTAAPTGAANVLCFRNDSDLSVSQIGTAFNAALNPDPWDWISNTLTVPSAIVKKGPDSTGPQGTFATSIVGLETGATGPAAPSLLIRKNTAAGGRKNRGRMFLPGIPEVRMNPGGLYDAANIPGVLTAVETFFADMALADLELCVEHTDGSTPTLVTSFTVEAVLATQRRRQRR